MPPTIWITIPTAATTSPVAFSFAMSDNGVRFMVCSVRLGMVLMAPS